MIKEISIYLQERRILDKDYLSFIEGVKNEELCFKLCTVDGFDFMVSHFFDDSDVRGRGLIPTNNILKTSASQFTAIGLIEGDDVICMSSLNGAIYIWLIQTGRGELIEASKSFAEFMKMCVE